MEYTTIVGVDVGTIQQLKLTWPTWTANKPHMLYNPMVIFYDRGQVSRLDILEIVDHPDLNLIAWPTLPTFYEGSGKSKWNSPQRAKMLAGFVYVAAEMVETDYWLKLDTDVVATGHDGWIDREWFRDEPAIVAPKWGYTKPPNQMMDLDRWVNANAGRMLFRQLIANPPLKLIPNPNENKVKHRRICSWCAFFRNDFTEACAILGAETAGHCKLPVPSQDGYQWYVAKRSGLTIREIDPKSRGWVICNGLKKIKQKIEEFKCGEQSFFS